MKGEVLNYQLVFVNYITSIKTAILIFPFIAFLFTVPFILYQYHKYGSINKLRGLIVYSFILYLITIYFLVILPLPKASEVTLKEGMVRLIPFTFIKDFISETSLVINNPKTYIKALAEPCFYTIVFNILMTIPFGMYLRYYFKCNLKKTIIFSFLLSLFFEVTQLTGLYYIYDYPYRVFDVDDLIINTIGGLIGYLIMGLFKNILPSREKIDEDSFRSGRKVSGLRRVCVFLLDLFIFIIISLIFKSYYIKALIFIFCYLFIPYVTKGKTLGGCFLNVRCDSDDNKIIRAFLKNVFIYFYYFGIPMFIIFAKNYLNVMSLLFIMIIFIFYINNVFSLLKKGKAYYDDIFKITYESTIKGDNDG